MKGISLFSGIGGIDKGFEKAGIETVLQVEQDRHCLAVLARHWPQVERLTDVRLVLRDESGAEWARCSIGDCVSTQERGGADRQGRRRANGIDLIYGGFPCQDVSVAGQRAGLSGERSGLWFEFQRILGELRPRWCVIENVPGLLSSNSGRDFAVILDGLDQLGYGVAWRILDAQSAGVPQRRRRVFIVGCLGDVTAAAAVLAVRDSGSGDSQESREAGEDVAGTLSARSAQSRSSQEAAQGFFIPAPDQSLVMPTLDTHLGDKQWLKDQSVTNFGVMDAAGAGVRRLTPLECERLQGFPDGWTEYSHVGGRATIIGSWRDPLAPLMDALASSWTGRTACASCTTSASRDTEASICRSAAHAGLSDAASVIGWWETGREATARAITSHGSATATLYAPSGTLLSDPKDHLDGKSTTGALPRLLLAEPFSEEKSSTISTLIRAITTRATSTSLGTALSTARFTVLWNQPPPNWSDEACWSLETVATRPNSDSHRYRQLGNAVAVPCAEYIGHRLMRVEELLA